MRNKWLAAPYVVWMAIFVVAPMVLVVVFAFTGQDGSPTLGNFSNMGTYLPAFQHSFVLAFAATAICILIGYPLAYFLSRERLMVRKVAMMLIMLPMWMNFLLRTYAWMSLLENNGLINQAFSALGIIDLGNAINGGLNSLCAWLNDGLLEWVNGLFGSDFVLNTARPTDQTFFRMLFTQGAVVLGMVYNYLPFMVLPIFSVIDKIDPRVVEAAQDLGANGAMVFRKVIFPLSLPGVLSGVTMVFIPSVSTFALSRLLGGGKTLLLGDLIEMQFLGNAYNPHLGSAIALVMMVIVLVMMAVMNRFGEGEEGVAVL